MSPIEEHLVNAVTRELATLGIGHADVAVLSAEAGNWRYRIAAGERCFEVGFNHRDQLWARETTPGAEKHLVSNDAPRIHTSTTARTVGLQLIRCALLQPQTIIRDPPVI